MEGVWWETVRRGVDEKGTYALRNRIRALLLAELVSRDGRLVGHAGRRVCRVAEEVCLEGACGFGHCGCLCLVGWLVVGDGRVVVVVVVIVMDV
jgi:hypothetical protein